MPSAPLPIDEARRLATLRACNILDTEPQQAFDELVKLAVHVAEAPIALISLVDESRQWFKAKIGLDVCETPREHAFCAYTILGPKPLIVEDTALDARFADSPLVTGVPGVRFYAGFPLEAGDGLRLGTLCVLDTRARQLRPDQVSALQTLAHQASDQLMLWRGLRNLNLLREREQVLADRSLEARASESFRVGQLLHKGLAVELSEIAECLRSCRTDAIGVSRELSASLESSSERIAAAASDCRAVARRFRDFSLLSLGWLDSVRADVDRLQAEHGVQIVLEKGEDPDLLLHYAAAHRLAEFVHAALYAIIDRRAARQLRLSVSRRGSTLTVQVRYLGGRDGITSTAHPNSRMRVLAAELGSVVQESTDGSWNDLRLSVNLDPPGVAQAI
jgi:hypothetical protein